MTKEDRQLLLNDLSARLPYGVIVDYSYNVFDIYKGDYIKHGSKCILKCYLLDVFISPRQNEKGEYIKPYLRPMSSMTKEERKEYHSYCDYYYGIYFDTVASIDWLNKHHFDHRHLIEKGLSLEAPEGMYSTFRENN